MLPNEKFLNKIFVDKNIRSLYDMDLEWEKRLEHRATDAQSILYYQDNYIDIESPNDSALSRTVDPLASLAGKRSEGGLFPHTEVSQIVEKTAKMEQFALEIDVTEEELRYATMINQVLRKQSKLARQFANTINGVLGNQLSDSWTAGTTTLNKVQIATGAEWSNGPADTDVDIIGDIMDADELVRETAGKGYKPDTCLTSVKSFYDIMEYFAKKNYEYKFEKPEGRPGFIDIFGINIQPTNAVKRDFALMGDFKSCGVLWEAEPFNVEVEYQGGNRTYHIRCARSAVFTLTDPKALCLISNTIA